MIFHIVVSLLVTLLQAYQALMLMDLDQGQGLFPEVVTELNTTLDLALHATKQTAAAIGHSMTVMVVTVWPQMPLGRV